jgi:2-aminoadipate transaminase
MTVRPLFSPLYSITDYRSLFMMFSVQSMGAKLVKSAVCCYNDLRQDPGIVVEAFNALLAKGGKVMLDTAPTLEIALATWARDSRPSILQSLLGLATRPGMRSFAHGLPAPELFPVEDYTRAAIQVLASTPTALQYGPQHQPLKAHIVALMAQRGVVCREEQVFLTTGAQQAMSLLVHLLLDPGGPVLIEETIYSGFQQVLEPFRPTILTVPTDPETGVDVDAVARLLEGGARPAFMYAITDGHNPLGMSMSPAKRQRLVELARRYRMPIIEDDAYGFLCYEEPALPPLRALDEQWVFYVGSFSKILVPALRVGWTILPEALMGKMAALKEASDIDTATFGQRTIAAYLDMGLLPEHVAMLRREYRIRRDTMLRALREHFPDGARWYPPRSGMFVWVELPAGVQTDEVLNIAVATEQVAFVPGHAFGVGGSRRAANCLRLNFSNCPPEGIADGIARLGRVVRAACARVARLSA